MKYSYAVALGISLLAPITDGLAIQKRDSDEPRVLSLPIWKGPPSNPVKLDVSRMKKRETRTLESVIDNHVSTIRTNRT